MGDPKRIRKKYDTPSHPWIKSRIDEEKKITKEFGTKSKKEIWKMETVLKNFKSQAKKLISLKTPQAKVETEHLFRRVQELGLVKTDVSFDAILGLDINHLMARRLQSVVYTKGLAKTVGQARQFIVHGHVLVGEKKITSPAYLVSQKEETMVGFAVNSSLFNEDHPERASTEKLEELRVEKEAETKKSVEAKTKKPAQEAKKVEGEENTNLPKVAATEEAPATKAAAEGDKK
jgi:small subunit ribosomal protein S4